MRDEESKKVPNRDRDSQSLERKDLRHLSAQKKGGARKRKTLRVRERERERE